jgi:3-hydroxybutyrate dehydrogenase
MSQLKNKTALVTGSTSGIGLAIAHALAKAGANIMLNGFGDIKEIEALKNMLQKTYHVTVGYSAADVADKAALEKMVADTIQLFGRFDILVNNAGIQYVAPIIEFPDEKWEAILSINLTSAFRLSKLALPYMIKGDWGRIVNIASAHGMVASPFKSAYVAAKHGLVGLTKTVALEMAESNITCNVVCPGYVKTPLVEKQIAEQAKAYKISEDQVIKDVLLQAQPNKKFIKPENLADLVVFLCSDSAEGMTGEVIAMDGGWTAH